MEDNLILAGFICLPIATAGIAYLFFSRFAVNQAKMQWLKLIIGNVIVFLFLCSVILLGGEVYYRYIYNKPDAWGVTKVHLKWISRNCRFNNLGLRDSIDYQLKLLGKPRITFIGDSFTLGHGVNDVEKRFVNLVRAPQGPSGKFTAWRKAAWIRAIICCISRGR